MEAKRARIQKELEDLLSGGTNTNLMFAEAARTLASALASTASVSTAARGATAGGAGTSTGPASSTPLVDLDGREYTGFLDKKKAAAEEKEDQKNKKAAALYFKKALLEDAKASKLAEKEKPV
jgi:hypothetical protein